MTPRSEEIEKAMLVTFARNAVKDTIENRYAYLLGMLDAAKNGEQDTIDSQLHQMCLNTMLIALDVESSR